MCVLQRKTREERAGGENGGGEGGWAENQFLRATRHWSAAGVLIKITHYANGFPFRSLAVGRVKRLIIVAEQRPAMRKKPMQFQQPKLQQWLENPNNQQNTLAKKQKKPKRKRQASEQTGANPVDIN